MNIVNTSGKLILSFFCMFILTACDEFNMENDIVLINNRDDSAFFYPLEENNLVLTVENTVYIPVYSDIFVSGGGKLNLAITLSIRNTDFTYPLVVNKVNYYNTAGKLIENYLEVPYLLESMASAHFFVSQADARGGVGANFIVKWAANKLANEPVIEAVMAGSTGTQGMSFVSSGRVIKSKESLAGSGS